MLIAVVTPNYPTRNDPDRGQPIHQTVRALHRYADVRVLCAQAMYPMSEKRLTDGPLDPEEDITIIPFPAVPLLSRPWNGASCARHIYPHLADLRPDVVLNYWLYPEGYGSLLAARSLGVPVVVGARGSDLRRIQDPLTRRLVGKTIQQADRLLLVSEELRRHALAHGARADRIIVIPNGCDHKLFHAHNREQARLECGIRKNERVVLYVGRLAKAKGLPELLQAFSEVAKTSSDLRLVCVGKGPLRSSISSVVEKEGLRGRVSLTSSLTPPEVARWMRAADLFCLPSHTEGCPNVVIEAMTSGCPVVATNVGGIPEITGPDASILIPPRQPERLAEALHAGLARSWDRDAIAAARRRTWDDVARETVAVMENLTGRMAAPAIVRKRRPRITVVTSYFPSTKSVYRGHSAYQTLLAMQKMADIQVICPMAEYPLTPKVPVDEHQYGPFDTHYMAYPAVPMLTRPVNGWTCLRDLLPRLRETRPDLVLNYWLYPEGFSAVQAGRLLGVPAIVGSIGSDLRRIRDPFTRHYVKRTVREASAVITVSRDLRERAIAFGASPEKVTAILNGCDRSIFYPRDLREARRQIRYEHKGELILFVGSLLQTKGLAELVRAFAALSASRPDARLAIIGEGIFGPAIQQLISEKGVEGRVLLLGHKHSPDVGDWMRAADVFCLPSYSEGCPNVVVEALACGTPIVATDLGGIPELVRKDSGILIQPRDDARLRQTLEESLSRPWDRERIAKTSDRNWEDVGRETFEVCCRVLASERLSRRGAA